MGNALPSITLVTPSFNQGDYLEETIQSVIHQGYACLRYVIHDGGSTDQSVEIIRRYESLISRWASEADQGQADAISKGFASSNAEYLGWLNSDDALEEDALFRFAEAIQQNPDAVLFVGSCYKLDVTTGTKTLVRPVGLTAEEIAYWGKRGFFYQPATLFRRDAFEAVGGLNESLHNAMDVDLWIRLAQQGRIVEVDAVIATAKIHPDMKTLRHLPLRDAETIKVALDHGYPDAAVERLNEYARHYFFTEISSLGLVKELFARLLAKIRLRF